MKRIAMLAVAVSFSTSAFAQDHLFTVTGDQPGERFGFTAASAGDVNADGLSDLIVGAATGGTSGYARIFSGDGTTLLELTGSDYVSPNAHFGWSVGGVGDVDQDGHDDVIIGAPEDDQGRGSAWVLSGLDGSVLYSFTGTSVGATMGWSVSRAGDVDGDGRGDFIVGSAAARGDTIGEAFVFSGLDGSQIHAWSGLDLFEFFGTAVADVGDVDGDDFDDVIVGAPGNDFSGPASGSVYLYSGQTGSLIRTLHGLSTGDEFGLALDGVADFDGDTIPDLIVGAPQLFNSGPGYAHVISAADGGLLLDLVGAIPDEWFGRSVGSAGDFDGDGTMDFIVGAPNAEPNGSQSGRVSVHSGSDGSIVYEIAGQQPFDHMGDAAGVLADINGDSVRDIFGGAPIGYVEVHSGDCGLIQSYGDGCAGSGGFVPILSADGCPTSAGTLSLSCQDGLGGASALILFGLGRSDIPIGGGCRLLVAPLISLKVPILLDGQGPGDGDWTLTSQIPLGIHGGLITMQAFIIDPGTSRGLATTNAIEIQFL